MKRILLFFLLCIAYRSVSYAEDILNVTPAVIGIGVVEDDEIYLEIDMRNPSFDMANLQFDILFPEGMEYLDYYEFSKRIPDNGKTGKKQEWYFDVQTNKLSNGFTRFVFVPSAIGGELKSIEKGEGCIMTLQIATAPNIQPGIYPIVMQNIKLIESVTSKITIDESSSYVVVSEDGTTSPLPTATNVDLSGMTGYIPSFVVESLNTALTGNSNLRMLNLSGATELGADLALPDNEDLLWYTANKASFNRTFTANQWSTVCLPFGMSSEQVATLKSNGCIIEKLADYNATDGYVDFTTVDATEAHTPYLVKSSTTTAPFADLNVATIGEGAAPIAVTVGNMSMIGSYSATTVSSSASVQCFGFSAADGSFKTIATGTNIPLKPFRAYLALSGVSSAPSILGVAHDGNTTGITLPLQRVDDIKVSDTYNLQGYKVNRGMSGKGIFIQKGKKILMK